MRIVFAGTPQVALPSLEALLASDHEVVAVLTRPDAPSGRGKKLTPSPVAARAAELGIETLTPAKPREPEFLARLAEIAPDCCPVVAYGALLPQNLLDLVPHGFINLHFSLLPAWRGAAPVQHAVLAGDAVTGATTFRIVAALDAGPTFATVTEPIGATDTSGDLLRRLSVSGARLLVSTLDGIADGSLTATEQPERGRHPGAQDPVEDARIDWSRPAVVIDRVIRGCAPAPGAWTTFRGERFKINSATPVPDQVGAVGELTVTKRSVTVAAGDGTGLELGQVQAQGKKPMPAPDWARGVTFTAAKAWRLRCRPRGHRPGDEPSIPARRAAFDGLRSVHVDDAYANLVLPPLLTQRRITGRDAAFATELLAGTERPLHTCPTTQPCSPRLACTRAFPSAPQCQTASRPEPSCVQVAE